MAKKADEQDTVTTQTEGKWFILERNIGNFMIPVETMDIKFHPHSGEKIVKGKDHFVRFDNGLYYTDDPAEIEAIQKYCTDDRPPYQRVRECSEHELLVIDGYKKKGFPRKEWHQKLMVIREAENPLSV